MSAENYINRVKARNMKVFSAAKIELTPQELERQLKAAYIEGLHEGKAAEAAKKSLFETIFGHS